MRPLGPLGLEDHGSHEPAHWSKVTGLPINAELAYASNWLRAQAEYEISSNPVMEGMVNTFKTDVVGPEGPTYRVQSSDPDYNAKREKVWRRWAKHAGATGSSRWSRSSTPGSGRSGRPASSAAR